MFDGDFFSRTATTVIALLLVVVVAWAVWTIGPTAIQRWFG